MKRLNGRDTFSTGKAIEIGREVFESVGLTGQFIAHGNIGNRPAIGYETKVPCAQFARAGCPHDFCQHHG